jgi:putative PIN family toxin of toxin-antitoxin system
VNPVKLRTVFDSNIYVAAALRPGQYADRWLDIATLPSSSLMLYVSAEVLAEVQHKLINRFGFTEPEVKRLMSRIKLATSVVKPKNMLSVVPNDPDDNVIVECAVEAKAHLIVSDDKHLLKLGQYKAIGITRPRELKRIFATDFEG